MNRLLMLNKLRREKLFKDEGGRRMEDKLNIQDLQEQLQESTGYMLGITFLKNGILTHHFLTNNFPTNDIRLSLSEIRKLALSSLKPKEKSNIDDSKK